MTLSARLTMTEMSDYNSTELIYYIQSPDTRKTIRIDIETLERSCVHKK